MMDNKKQNKQVKRLFVSLYLLVSLSVLGIGWTLDSLWQKSVDDNGNLDAPLIALAQLLEQLPQAQRQSFLDNLTPNEAYPLQLLDTAQVSLSENQQLTSDKVFTISPDDKQQLQFIAVGEQVLMSGPTEIDPRSRLRTLFTLVFYLLLGLVALIWVWPLSRDLNVLRSAAHGLGQAKWDTRISVPMGSQVRPLADTFNEMARHIGQLIENQKHLSNAVSHEIRTPLARLKFALALLPQHCLSDSDISRREEYFEGMQQDIAEMETLLQELLTYASLESQKGHEEFEQIDLIGLTQHTVARLQAHQTIEIAFNYSEQNLSILGDSSLVERAIQNLITNAQRFAQQNIKVTIALSKQNEVQLSVEDDGEGILEEDQIKIFEPFYRSATKQNGNKGHGLGLAIIKRIMSSHKGYVSLESHPGMTCFTLIFPTFDEQIKKQSVKQLNSQ